MIESSHEQGVCVWLTGLSGAGKSTTAEALARLLRERGCRVTVLDGDQVPPSLSLGPRLGKEERDRSVRGIGLAAAEVVRRGGAVVCAAVSPDRSSREDVRDIIGPERFVEVFLDTPPEECERRDTKGMYARARRGEIKHLIGVDDPYEAPTRPEIRLETVGRRADDNARLILSYLLEHGLFKDDEGRNV
jgi:sulfate adenylyltransferase